MKKTLFFLFSFFILVSGFCQETAPRFLVPQNHMNLFNPAFSGVNKSGELCLGFQKQALTFSGTSQAQTATYSKAFSKNVGLGFSFLNNEVFVTKQTAVAFDFSYKLQLAASTNLYLGLKAGISTYNIDFSSLEVQDPLFQENLTTSHPLIGVGFYMKGPRYFVHLSSPNFLLNKVQQPKYDEQGVVSEPVTEKCEWYFGTGYRISVRENFDLIPAVFSRWVVRDSSQSFTDLRLSADILKLLELGLAHRWQTSWIASILIKSTGNLHFGYGHEFTTGNLNPIAPGTHVFSMRFRWE